MFSTRFEPTARERLSARIAGQRASGTATLSRLRPQPVAGVSAMPAVAAEVPPVSAIVTTFNEADKIAACLESLLWCDEILVVDSHSTDRTVEIASRYRKVRVEQRTYFGAASQKNWAMDRLANDWVLILDADERVTPELRAEIEQVLSSPEPAGAYSIPRHTYVLGRRISRSGWQHDRVVRLFKRGEARYPNRRVHADMLTREPAPVLEHGLVHLMVDDFAEYAQRIAKYAVWGAAQLWVEKRRSRVSRIVARSAWRFLRTYVVQGGFLDGMHGLVLCLLGAYGTLLKWATLWSWQEAASMGRGPDLPVFDEDPQTWAWPNEDEAPEEANASRRSA
jgi:hypothetical protein